MLRLGVKGDHVVVEAPPMASNGEEDGE